MFGFHLRRQWQQLLTQRRSLISLSIYAGLCLWSLLGGLNWQAEREAALSETPAELLTDREAWMEELALAASGGEVSPYAARPMGLTFLAVHEPSALSGLAFRNESIHSRSTLINGWRSEASLFRRYEVQGPAALWAGRLDLAFLVTAFLPLFLLVLSFDVLSSERESGRFPLFLAQGGSAAQLAFARVVIVAIPLFALATACVLAAGLLHQAPMGSVLLWVCSLFVYTVFWCGVATLIAVWFPSSTSAALSVLAVWALVVVLLPSGAQFVSQTLHPLPSRVSYLSEARDAEASTRRNLDERAEIYMAEHPGQSDSPESAVPGYYRAAYLANLDINSRTAPIIQAMESRQSAQRSLVDWFGLLSPAIVVQRAIESASGTGPTRAAEFRHQAREFLNLLLDEIGPATVSTRRLTLEQARAIPEFTFKEAPVPGLLYAALLWVLGLGTIFLMLAWHRARFLS